MALTCVINFFTKKGKNFESLPSGDVRLKIPDGRLWDFYTNGYWVQYENGGVPTEYGDWSCDGEENYQIISKKSNRIYRSSTNKFEPYVNPDLPAQLDPAFSCVTQGLTSIGLSFEIKDNIYVVATLKSGTKWYFYQTKPGVRPWVEVTNKTMTLTGTWSCVGESNFQLTRSDGKTFVGGNTSWEGEGQPDTSTEPEGDDSFPLKEGKRGPNVVKLQKFLNDKIPSNPLTVNGIFDEKTKNKLIEYQKREGII